MTQQEVIKSFMKSLDDTSKSGTSALNEAIATCSNNKYTTIQSVINKMISDCKSTNNATKFLNDYCGIVLDNSDTGAITGSDAGNSTTKTSESIVPEVGSLSFYTNNSFTTDDGITFSLKKNYSSLTSYQKFMWNGLYTWWADNSLDLIAESYGSNYNLPKGTNLSVDFVNNSNFLAATYFSGGYDGYYRPTGIEISNTYYSHISTSNENGYDSYYGQGYLDRVLAHELTHAAMGANIYNFYSLPNLIIEGMAELTHGIDDERKNDIKTLAGNSSLLSRSLVLSTNYNEVAGVNAPDYAGGYMLLRYMAKQFSDGTSSDGDTEATGTTIVDSFTFTNNADYYTNTVSNTVLSGLNGNDTIVNNGGNNVYIYGDGDKDILRNIKGNNITLYGGQQDDYIYTDKQTSNISILGGSGNDTMVSEGSNVYINTSSGNDIVSLTSSANNNIINTSYYEGNDTVYGFDTNDTVQIYSGNIKDTIISGNDLIINISNSYVDGSLTLKNVKGQDVKLILGNNTITTIKTYEEENIWRLSNNNLTYGTSTNTLITVKGVNSKLNINNDVSLNGNVVTLNSNALTTSNVTISNGYTLALSSDVKSPVNSDSKWTISGTTAKLSTSSTTAGYTLSSDKKSITYTGASEGKVIVTINGLKNGTTKNDISLNGTEITLSANALGTSKVTVSSGYTLKLASDVITPVTKTDKSWIISGNKAKLVAGGTTAGYVLSSDSKSITYQKENNNTKTIVTISGINKKAKSSDFKIDENNKVITISNNALTKTSKVTVSSGYTLKLANDVATPDILGDSWKVSGTTAVYSSNKKSAGYVLSNDNRSISYSKGSNGKTELTLKGLTKGLKVNKKGEISGITVDDTVVTLGSKAIGNTTIQVKGPKDYTYILSKKGAIKNIGNNNATFEGSTKNDTITGGSKSDTVYGNNGSDKINGGAGNDYLDGGNGADSIFGGAGNDTLIAGAGKDTLTGGKGKDLFVFDVDSGKSVITDYTSQDKIEIYYDYTAKVSGKNVIFTMDSGSVTVINGANKKITVNDETKTYSSKKKTKNSNSISNLLYEDNYVTSTTNNTTIRTILPPIETSALEFGVDKQNALPSYMVTSYTETNNNNLNK